ncbi:FAD-dependent protein [Pseudothermotoga sp.]|nr:NAD(P)/FAD-dependent oxidoreductase [Pseudothermotoga sp.]MCX7812376.1 NAD(P)/FAD-dependent oxidoreductase [Pseudothermotoga sp.]MDW8140170.1 NAD(P)/FAD-dependent oxidoreductase [Pseudothermotoga sp.]
MKRLGIVGFGAAAIGFLEGLIETGKINDYEITVFEKGKDHMHNTISGVRMDGKIFISRGMGGELDVPLDIQYKIVELYLTHSGYKPTLRDKSNFIEYLKSFERNGRKIEFGESFSSEEVYKRFYDHGFEPVKAYFFHLGTDVLRETNNNLFEYFTFFKNIQFLFNTIVEDIELGPKHKVVANKGEFTFDELVISVGRSGHKLMDRIKEKYPQLVKENYYVDIGIRYELPNHVMEEFFDMYEVKVRYRTRTGYMCRLFCQNPSGKVTLEKYDEFTTVNGYSDTYHKTDNTNFAVLVTTRFTEPFKDPTGYGKNLAKLANILAGDKEKVILQTYGDFKEYRRTKRIGRVYPTLNGNSFILGDANLVFPSKIRESLVDFIDNLDRVIKGVAYFDNLLYAVEVKFYSNKFCNDIVENLHVIGDCSGWTRSIQYATAMGYMRAIQS